MLQSFSSLLDVSRSFAGQMRDETNALRWRQYPRAVFDYRSRRRREHCKTGGSATGLSKWWEIPPVTNG
jgi:hypothetical protein